MDLNRAEILEILQGMCVELPADTKLPLDALNQRLTRALSLAQAPLKSTVIDPGSLKRWSVVSKAPLFDLMGALNMREEDMMDVKASGRVSVSPALLNTFMFLRVVVGQIGEFWDSGSRLVVIANNAGNYSFTIRVRSSSDCFL